MLFRSLIIKGAASQTADLQQWQDSSGNVLVRVDNSGTIITRSGIGVATNYITSLTIGAGAYLETSSTHMYLQTRAATNIGLIIKGTASQTANLQEWQQSDTSVPTAIDSYGKLRVRTFGYMAGASLDVYTSSSGNAGIIVKGVSSQTANLQEWQNSAGTVLSSINASGQLELNGKDVEIMNIMGAY